MFYVPRVGDDCDVVVPELERSWSEDLVDDIRPLSRGHELVPVLVSHDPSEY
jgi:hypothetical protein